MNLFYLFIFILVFSSCGDNRTNVTVLNDQKAEQVLIPRFESIIDSAIVNGSILIYDLGDNRYYSNDFEWADKGNLPASTFKIPNSIVALETGVIEDDHTILIWDGEPKRMKNWEQDLTFRDAFHYSCVPCYQEIARKVGVKKMRKYLDKIDYKTMIFDSSDIDLFWLAGDSHINQFQQIEFLKRFYLSEIPISTKTEMIMKRMMIIDKNDDYTLSGKTGWSIRDGHNNGWFVGYIEKGKETYFFATNITPKEEFDMKMFSYIRKQLTENALKEMGIM